MGPPALQTTNMYQLYYLFNDSTTPLPAHQVMFMCDGTNQWCHINTNISQSQIIYQWNNRQFIEVVDNIQLVDMCVREGSPMNPPHPPILYSSKTRV